MFWNIVIHTYFKIHYSCIKFSILPSFLPQILIPFPSPTESSPNFALKLREFNLINSCFPWNHQTFGKSISVNMTTCTSNISWRIKSEYHLVFFYINKIFEKYHFIPSLRKKTTKWRSFKRDVKTKKYLIILSFQSILNTTAGHVSLMESNFQIHLFWIQHSKTII